MTPQRSLDEQRENGLRIDVRAALVARDLDALTRVAFLAGIGGRNEAYERIAHEELDELDEATRHWWQGPCNCHGQLN